MNRQSALFNDGEWSVGARRYLPLLTATENEKGVLDVDTVKGCTLGMASRPEGGCYGECYAQKTASRYGIDFAVSVNREIPSWNWTNVFCAVRDHYAYWYRIGVAGDPCHDWEHTVWVCESLSGTGKIPVIITKHWIVLSDAQILRLKAVHAVVNTSTSGLDTDAQMRHRVRQIERLKAFGVRSVNRVITCEYGKSEWALACKARQDYLLTITPLVDNPLRAQKSNPRVVNSDIILTNRPDSIGGGKLVSMHCNTVYIGICEGCPDQCGADRLPELERNNKGAGMAPEQVALC